MVRGSPIIPGSDGLRSLLLKNKDLLQKPRDISPKGLPNVLHDDPVVIIVVHLSRSGVFSRDLSQIIIKIAMRDEGKKFIFCVNV